MREFRAYHRVFEQNSPLQGTFWEPDLSIGVGRGTKIPPEGDLLGTRQAPHECWYAYIYEGGSSQVLQVA